MEDNAHMSEKLLLSEQAQESLRVIFFKLESFYLQCVAADKNWYSVAADKNWYSVAADKNW